MEQNADELVQAARQLVPVDEGKLRDSIGWTWGDAPAGSISIGSVANNATGTMRITVYAGDSETFYARFIEFGTEKSAANPFFFPAYRALRRRMRGRLTRQINKAIKDAARS